MLPISSVDKNRQVQYLDLKENNLLVPRLEQSRNYIYSIDFSMLIYKITTPDPNIARIWDKDAAMEIVDYYKNYLWLLRKYSDIHPIIPPSLEIDEIWHHHILDTYKYHDDCTAIFGQYLHHYPYYGMRGEDDYKDLQRTFAITQHLHYQEFGENIMSFEEESAKIAPSGAWQA